MTTQAVQTASFEELLTLSEQRPFSADELRAIQRRLEEEECALDKAQAVQQPNLDKVKQEREQLARDMERLGQMERMLKERKESFIKLDTAKAETARRSKELEQKLSEGQARHAGVSGQQRDMDPRLTNRLLSLVDHSKAHGGVINVVAREDEQHYFVSMTIPEASVTLCEMMLRKDAVDWK